LFFFLIEEEHLFHRAVRSSLFLVVFLKRSLSEVLCASFFVLKSLIKAVVHVLLTRCSCVPLTERMDFKATLQKGNRVQLPKLVRWRFKLETSQILKVTVTAVNVFGGWETFYGKMDKSGRLTIPKLALKQIQSRRRELQSLTGTIMEVRVEPA